MFTNKYRSQIITSFFKQNSYQLQKIAIDKKNRDKAKQIASKIIGISNDKTI